MVLALADLPDSATGPQLEQERKAHQRTDDRNNVAVVSGSGCCGTAVNYTLVDGQERFLVEGLCEILSLAKQGPEICRSRSRMAEVATDRAGVALVTWCGAWILLGQLARRQMSARARQTLFMRGGRDSTL